MQRDSKHMFLRIDTLQPQTELWARRAAKLGGWSANSIQITENWFKEGLRPFSLTRDLKWGVPVPLEKMRDKVLYVWFDAPIGYPSITANYTEDWEQWWKSPDQVTLIQFMGKDNVRFHTVIFPSCLIGTGEPWTMLHQISTSEYLQYEGGKFSKSRNVGVFGDRARDVGVPASVWRYYLLANRPETSDTQFAWAEFIHRNNGELLANLGNLFNRVLTFVAKKYDSTLPAAPLLEGGEEVPKLYTALVDDVNALLLTYYEQMDAAKIRAGIATMMAVSARGNLFLSESGLDNALFANKRDECDATVLLICNLLYLLTPLVHPFMPSTADAMLAQLNAPARALPLDAARWPGAADGLLPGHVIGKPAHLFKRIDEKMEETWKAQFGGAAAASGGAAAAAAAAAEPAVSKSKAAKLAKQAKKAAAAAAAAGGSSSAEAPGAAGAKEKEKEKEREASPELLALQKKIEEQGKLVRARKEEAKKPDAPADAQAQADAEVQALLKLK